MKRNVKIITKMLLTLMMFQLAHSATAFALRCPHLDTNDASHQEKGGIPWPHVQFEYKVNKDRFDAVNGVLWPGNGVVQALTTGLLKEIWACEFVGTKNNGHIFKNLIEFDFNKKCPRTIFTEAYQYTLAAMKASGSSLLIDGNDVLKTLKTISKNSDFQDIFDNKIVELSEQMTNNLRIENINSTTAARLHFNPDKKTDYFRYDKAVNNHYWEITDKIKLYNNFESRKIFEKSQITGEYFLDEVVKLERELYPHKTITRANAYAAITGEPTVSQVDSALSELDNGRILLQDEIAKIKDSQSDEIKVHLNQLDGEISAYRSSLEGLKKDIIEKDEIVNFIQELERNKASEEEIREVHQMLYDQKEKIKKTGLTECVR